jgi:hypothetical protein
LHPAWKCPCFKQLGRQKDGLAVVWRLLTHPLIRRLPSGL